MWSVDTAPGRPSDPVLSLARRAAFVASVAGLVGASVAAVAGGLWAVSPGRPRPITDDQGRPVAGSISEKSFAEIDDARQGMFIKGRDAHNPILLYLHGGIPDTFLTQGHPTGLEELFTVVWWEMRGSGLSWHPAMRPGSSTLDQLVADTIALTNHLRDRFGQDRIYLMGHSGGSFVGIHAAARAPELFHAYIGVAQMVDQLRSERLAYDYMLAESRKRNDTAMVRRLEAAPVTAAGGTPPAYLAIRDVAMHRLGIGTMRDMRSIVTGLVLPSLTFREYTLREKVNLWRAKRRNGVSALWPEMLATDLSRSLRELAIPTYFLHGIDDFTCSYPLAKAYAATLRRPSRASTRSSTRPTARCSRNRSARATSCVRTSWAA
jgi:pimeloyl-ACP methyl ester carboxylesterase